MSTITQVLDLLMPAIEGDIKAAWGDNVKIHYEIPETEQTQIPYAVIDLDDIGDEFGGEGGVIGGVEMTINASILGVFARPAANDAIPNRLFWKAAKSDALTSRLCAAPGYATLGYLPLITNRDLKGGYAPQKQVIDIAIDFQVRFAVDHH